MDYLGCYRLQESVRTNFNQMRQTMPELESDDNAIFEPCQLCKQSADLFLQLELLRVGDRRIIAFTTQSRNAHDSRIVVEDWLARSDVQILKSTELNFGHELYQVTFGLRQVSRC